MPLTLHNVARAAWSAGEIQQMAALYFGVSLADILGRSKTRSDFGVLCGAGFLIACVWRWKLNMNATINRVDDNTWGNLALHKRLRDLEHKSDG